MIKCFHCSHQIKKFPLINLGKKILSKYDHIGMIIFTVINEKLGKMFLKNEIKYGDIVKILINTFKNKKYLISNQISKI